MAKRMFDGDIFGGDHRELAEDVPAWQRFQSAVGQMLTREYSPDDYEIEQTVHRGRTTRRGLCPDFVVRDGGRILCVADSKCVQRLTVGDARDVARYSRLRPADGPPRIYVPVGCHVQRGARDLANRKRVHIVEFDEGDL